ncbi:penicillin-binding protein 1A [Chitinimonas sp.]|uniref:penicillin-binding protein 1A n=1 Tax=Chitinimonas sp. TaxID=1934313 RepID=UPI0035B20619
MLWTTGVLFGLTVTGALLIGYALFMMQRNLPPLDALTDFRPKLPLRIYTADQVLIGEFGEERRNMVHFKDIPPIMVKAVLAIEDYRYYEHGGVDFIGITRSLATNLFAGHIKGGASTITQQVARNFFLSREQTYTRKIYEMLLAYRIESVLNKDQILEIYMNQIALGQHAFGFASAARVYFGKDLKDISIAEAAMLAGLPKAPSAYNPVVNFKRAKIRQEYILKRMFELGYINREQYDKAVHEVLHVVGNNNDYKVHGEFVAEMVRQTLYAQYKEELYTRGYNVTTTVRSADQEAAYRAVRAGVLEYDRRHGYRGPEGFVTLPDNPEERQQAIDDALEEHPNNDELISAVVLEADPKQITALPLNGEPVVLRDAAIKFGASALSLKIPPANRIRRGSIIRIVKDAKGNWQLAQLPQVEAALVSLAPENGAVRALVGGFDFDKNKFNRVTQSGRQPGSTFKPIVYSAALEKGIGPATLVLDAPLNLPPEQTGGQPWDPKDDDPPAGPMPLRVALTRSVNLVAIRTLRFIGTGYVQQWATRFGFDADKTPPYLPMALGAGQASPLQVANAYAVFANGGYRVNPYVIDTVSDSRGTLIAKAKPVEAGKDAPRVIDARNAYIMETMLKSVAQRGTGARTNELKRTDIAGKTGTTNDARDGWFAGYQHSLVAVAWLGYDQPRSLGSREFGAQLALPVWLKYMEKALKDVPQYQTPIPDGITVIDGEPYYNEYTPGNGFVATIDIHNGDNPESGGEEAPAIPDGLPLPNPGQPVTRAPERIEKPEATPAPDFSKPAAKREQRDR